MDHITLENSREERFVFSIGELMATLHQLTDPRKARGKRYTLPFLLILILLAKLAGEDTPKGIAEWLQLRRAKSSLRSNQHMQVYRLTTPFDGP